MKVRERKLKPGEIIPLNLDFMFTNIFNKKQNIDILENFISCYLEIPLEKVKGKIKLMKRRLILKNKKQAGKEIDLLFDYEGRKINIELSNASSKEEFIERNIVYICDIHSNQLKYKDKHYKNIKESIQINLNNFKSNKNEIREIYYLKNEQGEKLSNKLRIDTG